MDDLADLDDKILEETIIAYQKKYGINREDALDLIRKEIELDEVCSEYSKFPQSKQKESKQSSPSNDEVEPRKDQEEYTKHCQTMLEKWLVLLFLPKAPFTKKYEMFIRLISNTLGRLTRDEFKYVPFLKHVSPELYLEAYRSLTDEAYHKDEFIAVFDPMFKNLGPELQEQKISPDVKIIHQSQRLPWINYLPPRRESDSLATRQRRRKHFEDSNFKLDCKIISTFFKLVAAGAEKKAMINDLITIMQERIYRGQQWEVEDKFVKAYGKSINLNHLPKMVEKYHKSVNEKIRLQAKRLLTDKNVSDTEKRIILDSIEQEKIKGQQVDATLSRILDAVEKAHKK